MKQGKGRGAAGQFEFKFQPYLQVISGMSDPKACVDACMPSCRKL